MRKRMASSMKKLFCMILFAYMDVCLLVRRFKGACCPSSEMMWPIRLIFPLASDLLIVFAVIRPICIPVLVVPSRYPFFVSLPA